MHQLPFRGLALFAATLASPLAAAPVTADPAEIAAILQREGYQAKLAGQPGEPRIETAMSGYQMAIYFYGCDAKGQGCKSVQFYAGFNPTTSPTLQAMNDYARDNRWGRIYLDKENDPVIEMDVDLEVGGMSEELFLDNIAYWDTILTKFADFVFKKK